MKKQANEQTKSLVADIFSDTPPAQADNRELFTGWRR